MVEHPVIDLTADDDREPVPRLKRQKTSNPDYVEAERRLEAGRMWRAEAEMAVRAAEKINVLSRGAWKSCQMGRFDAALRDIPNFSTSKEDLMRCLDDWNDRGSTIDFVTQVGETKLVCPYGYRKMPKKPWATKEWVHQRDFKLFTLMSDHFSPAWWKRLWTFDEYGFERQRPGLLPPTPKLSTNPISKRLGKLFRERCREAIRALYE